MRKPSDVGGNSQRWRVGRLAEHVTMLGWMRTPVLNTTRSPFVQWPFRYCVVGSLGFGSAACLPDIEEQQGGHIIYEYSASHTPCRGNLRYMKDFVAFFGAQTEIRLDGLYRYSWLSGDDRQQLPHACDAEGCTIGRHAISGSPILPHELVHAVMTSVSFRSPPFFREGIAVAYTPLDGPGPRYPSFPRTDPRSKMTAGTIDVDFSAAQGFVTFLLARHGATKFIEFYWKLRFSDAIDSIQRAFESTYGALLDEEVAMYISNKSCPQSTFTVVPFDCTNDDIPWGAENWLLESEMDCVEDENVAGGFSPTAVWPSLRAVTLEVPVSGRYRLELSSSGGLTEIRLGQCFGCPWDQRDVSLASGDSRVVDLQKGRHFLRMTAQSNESPHLAVYLSPLP